jgi:predicted aminopeptidase
MHSAYHQTKLLQRRKSIDRVLKSDKLNEEQKAKLRLVQEVKAFAEDKLGLERSSNYTSFVQLDEPYVTYIVQAAHYYELKPFLWKFPFVGDVPYKGYFRKSLAEREAEGFDHTKYDTMIRGVSAYSTLGWFQDSVLSSMLRYEEHDLVETIIHETIHTTLYIKSAAEFNERLATFMGHAGMMQFYLEKEGKDSIHLKKARDEGEDQKLFSEFLTNEIDELKKWYADNAGKITPQMKSERLSEIKKHFTENLKPKLKLLSYSEFAKGELNNAILLAYQTYEYNLDDFAKVFTHFDGDFKKTMEYLKTLKNQKRPETALKEFASNLANSK